MSKKAKSRVNESHAESKERPKAEQRIYSPTIRATPTW